ncbi:uncharacterized protein [Linepithema humile]|uniref:uncharacterized protein isoform X2 n=1 Tax=Linepithema humile TaxID=83485 RepID=UPI0006232FEE|nr:PREDICTED: uncharacterized protein LOC105674041 isoform X2 [Linepithema humile]
MTENEKSNSAKIVRDCLMTTTNGGYKTEIRTFIDILEKDRQLQRWGRPVLDSLIRFTVNTFRWKSRHGASKQQQQASKQARHKKSEEAVTMAEPETAQRQTTLSRDKKPRERERISPSRFRRPPSPLFFSRI